MLDQNTLDALMVLIDCLRTTPRMDDTVATQMREAHSRAVVARMFKTGESWGESAGGALSFLAQPDALAQVKSIDNDLTAQIKIVSDSFVEYLDNGEIPAPYYPWRIAIILRKAKLPQTELDFLRAWCLHFGTVTRGARYKMLAERRRKLEEKHTVR